MVVGTGVIKLFIPECRSLKEKRSVIRKVVSRVRHNFNVSMAEVSDNDNWKRCTLGFAVVGNERGHIDSTMNAVMNFMDDLRLAEIVDAKKEMLNLSDSGEDAYLREGKFDEP
ncbi:MAG: DUF503 domain-containing protein [Syntrophales bacterium]|nr:DUF503 domain-containing protein [Syntrophales bacterium]